ncbi:MAG: O-acetyl-ADP-ribose deacetylase [Chloroflexota bacterium]|nr:O-acetyl-ADP-ribose deacetylase [Chloroflexota bacterium]
MEKKELLINNRNLSIAQGDITSQTTDAIVNAANPSLMGGGGVDGAIHQAGGPAILDACKQIVSQQGKLPTGKAVITTGGNLKAKYVIHTVGPVWRGGNNNEAALLKSSYVKCLKIAEKSNLTSISFPSISTGVYAYPTSEAARIAIKAVALFLEEQANSISTVVFVLFDSKTYNSYRSALQEITNYT